MSTAMIREVSQVSASPSAREGNMLIQLITPGVGSSGTYSNEVLESAASRKVFPAGTLMFADHPGEMDDLNRPERSIRDVAGVLVEDARWDGSALIAEAKTYSPWSQVLSEMKDAIGVSIRATATIGEADSNGHPVIKSIDKAISVDFVTAAGRGGAIREVYESARQRSDVIVREVSEVEEASATDRDRQLRDLVRTSHSQGRDQFAYVVDYDEAVRVVTFELEGAGDANGIHTQNFTIANDVATELTGDPVKVRRVVSYVPTTESVPVIPAGQSTTHESEEDNMPQIEEGRLAALEEAGRRVPTLVSERDTAVRRAEEAEAQAAEALHTADQSTAARIVSEAEYQFSTLERRGLLVELPMVEGRLDVAAFTQSVTEAVAEAAEINGEGRVRGLGSVTHDDSTDEDLSEAELDAELSRISGRIVKES